MVEKNIIPYLPYVRVYSYIEHLICTVMSDCRVTRDDMHYSNTIRYHREYITVL